MTPETYKKVIDLIEKIDYMSYSSSFEEFDEFRRMNNLIEDMKSQIRRILKDEVRETN